MAPKPDRDDAGVDARRARAAGRVDRRKAWSWLTRRMHYMRGDFMRPETYSQLGKLLMDPQVRQNDTANVLFYLAVADRFFGPVIEQLGRAGLTRQSERAWRRVIVEKPFGHDLASAAGPQCADPQDPVGRPDLSDRPFPRQGNGPEHHGAALRQRHLRAAMEPRPYRSRADHGRRDRGRRATRALLREDRRVTGHGAEPFVPAARHDREWSRRSHSMPTRCAPKKTELFEAIHPISPEDAVRGQYGSGRDPRS